MKPSNFSRVVGGFVFIFAIGLSQLDCLSQVEKWDPGVPASLFKDGKTEGKNPKPTHRLAPTDCDDCQKIVNQLQSALDDWYAMQSNDAQAQHDKWKNTWHRDAALPAGAPSEGDINKQRDAAMAGLGQPDKKDLDAKQKQQNKDAKDKKDTHGSKDALAKEIKKLSDALQECLNKNCAPTPTPTPTTGGGEQAPPPHTAPPEDCDDKVPELPPCFRSENERDEYSTKLDNLYFKFQLCEQVYFGAGTVAAYDPQWQDFNARVQKALAAIHEQRDKVNKVPIPCPTPTPAGDGGLGKGPGKGKGKAPRVPTGHNVSLPRETFAVLISTGKIKVETSGTGETIGHIADLIIQNLTDQLLTCAIPPMILESGSGKNQHYACPKGQNVALNPHQEKTVPMDGVCVNRSKPPVGKGVTGDLVVNEANPTIPQSENSHLPPKDANKLLRLCTSKYDAADKLQKDGQLKNLPYHDPQKQKDIVTQWSTWTDPQICQLLGTPPATKEDLRKVVYKQVQEPMTPETKKKIDKGIDTIFEKVELTSEKAKDLEKTDSSTPAEPTGEKGNSQPPPEQKKP